MEYENERARGSYYRQQQQQQQQSSSSGGGRVRRPAVAGMASTVAPYSPPGGRGGGSNFNNSNSYNRGGNNNGTDGSSSSSSSSAAGKLDVEQLAKSLQNPKSTVTLSSSDAAGLSPEQRHVVEAVLSGHSVFFTGPAGSGKSHVLSTIVRLLEDERYAIKNHKGQPRKIAITATTGIAACNVGGITINSFAGVGTAEGSVSEMAARVMGNEYSKKRWRDHDILVIDEISMMPGQFLDKLNFVAQRVRNNRSAFGGMQLLLCGDFFQLPPVNLSKCSFAFEAQCWPDVINCSILLKQIFRQNGDQRLMKILNEARVGELSSESAQILRTHSTVGGLGKSGGADDGIRPTLLESRNSQVDKANTVEMNKLPGEVRRFKSKDKTSHSMYEKMLQHCQAPETLELKVGAQVICLKNLDPETGIVNGSRGIIVDFKTAKNQSDLPREFRNMELPVVKFQAIDGPGGKSGDEEGPTKLIEPAEWTNKVGDATVSSRHQIPLRLAWALSVHKSQGMTIPNLAVSLRGVFEYGQAYVALSRATKLDTLTLRGFEERAFKAHPKVKQFYRLLESGGKIAGGDEKMSSKPASGTTTGSKGLTQSAVGNTNSVSVNASGTMRNMYQKQGSVNAGGKANNNPHQSMAATSTSAKSKTSPQLTEEQRARVEENRRKALARKQQKQLLHQTAGGSATSNATGASNTGKEGSRFFSKKPSPPNNNPYNPYAR